MEVADLGYWDAAQHSESLQGLLAAKLQRLRQEAQAEAQADAQAGLLGSGGRWGDGGVRWGATRARGGATTRSVAE